MDKITIKRICNVGVIPGVLFVIYLCCGLCLNTRLPTYLATHWDCDGLPDGSSDANIMFNFTMVGFLALWAVEVGEWLIRSNLCRRLYTPPIIMFTIMMIVILEIGTIMVNLDLHDWESADELSPWVVASMGIGPPVMAVAAYALETDFSVYHVHDRAGDPVVHVVHGRHGHQNYREKLDQPKAPKLRTFTGRNHILMAIELLTFAVPVLTIFGISWANYGIDCIFASCLALGSGVLGVVLLLVGAVVQVEVYETAGLIVKLGPLGLVRRKLNFNDIAHVDVAEISGLDYGGWGLRHVGHECVYLIRSGAAIRLHLNHHRRVVAATVEQADDAKEMICAAMEAENRYRLEQQTCTQTATEIKEGGHHHRESQRESVFLHTYQIDATDNAGNTDAGKPPQAMSPSTSPNTTSRTIIQSRMNSETVSATS